MHKKILILSGSPRKGGNSDLLCDAFLKGAKEAGHEVEKIRVSEKKIGYCKACYYCTKHDGACVIQDDMADVMQKIIDADVLVLASPVYFYSIDAQLKALIDRTVCRWTEVRNKDFYYIATAAEQGNAALECTIQCMRGFADCVNSATEKGAIYAGGFYEAGEIKDSQYMQQAYEMGKNV